MLPEGFEEEITSSYFSGTERTRKSGGKPIPAGID